VPVDEMRFMRAIKSPWKLLLIIASLFLGGFVILFILSMRKLQWEDRHGYHTPEGARLRALKDAQEKHSR
jgi:hypothetical protein